MFRAFSKLFLLTLVLLSVFAFSAVSFAAKKIDAAKEDLSDVKQKIEALKKELDSNQEAHHDAADALKESETAISVANRTIREIAKKQKENQSTLTNLKKQSLTLNEQLAEQQKQLSSMLYAQYAQGDQSYTQLILQNKNPSQISRDLKYQSYIEKAHAKLIDDMQANLNQVKKLHVETTEKLQEVADLKAKHETERKELEQQKQEKAKVLNSLASKIAEQSKQIDKLKRDEASLSNLVEKLAKIAAAKPKKKPKPSKSKPKKSNDEKIGEPLATNQETPDDSYSGFSFASLKGKLKLPVRGELTNRFGSTREDSGVSWKGLFIRATEGADVKSVASGRVVFSDWMRGFGNLIIVDHGGGYMSLYGNNQSVLKHEGDEVNAGDTIASVGNSGGNESNGLYYELRKQSKPFDPLSWSVAR
ncbi:MAG: murein hydrolase activator EnvC family protein [Methylophilaceae bacterium]